MSRSYEILNYISEEELRKFPIVHVKKGATFIPADKQKVVKLYYILQGTVDVHSTSYNGREFLIDQLGADDFIGKFSQLRGIDFQCSVKASSEVEMLDMTAYSKKLWDESTKLGAFFHYKTSNRVYMMYKLSMLRMLFSYEEIFAYWLLAERDERTNIIDDVKEVFLKMNVSDRQIYYLLKKFRELGMIRKEKNRVKILDVDQIRQFADNVCMFMEDV